MSVPMHVQVLLARMLGQNRKRGTCPCGNRESQQAKRHDPQSRDRDLGRHPGRLRGEAMQRCQGCTWSRESGADDGSLLAIAASCFMSSAMAERLASKSLQDQRPWQMCGESPRRAKCSQNFSADASPLPIDRGSSNDAEQFSFRVRTSSIRDHPTVLFGPP